MSRSGKPPSFDFERDIEAWLEAARGADLDAPAAAPARAERPTRATQPAISVEPLDAEFLAEEAQAAAEAADDTVRRGRLGGRVGPAILFAGAMAMVGLGGGALMRLEAERQAATASVLAPGATRGVRLAEAGVDGHAGALSDDGVALGAIETASVAPYLSAAEIATLLAERPIKCVPARPETAAQAAAAQTAAAQTAVALLGAAIDGVACETATEYRAATGLYTTRSRLGEEAVLEIVSTFTIEGDALCHDLASASVLAIGERLTFPEALAIERRVKAGYTEAGGDRLCQRLRAIRGAQAVSYRADAFVDGVLRLDRTDPRPFLMHPAR